MDEFEQFGGYQLNPNNNNDSKQDEFSQFGGYSILDQQNLTLGNRVASGGKAIIAGAGGAIPDTAALAYNLPVMGINKLRDIAYPDRKKDFPLIPSATEAIDRGIDSATGGYTNTPEDQKHINEALKFGASFATGGGLAKTSNKVLSTVGKFTGSTDKAQIAGAATAGGAMSYLQDQGASTGETLGGGFAANLGVNAIPALTKGGGNLLAKGLITATGLGKGKLNLDVAKAGKDLDINLPKAVVSEGKAIAYADRFLSHAPIAGNIMQKRYARIGEKALEELDKAYESVISSKELVGIEGRIGELYEVAKKTLPENAQIVPKNTIQAIKEIRDNISAPALSGDFTKLNTTINKIEKEFSPSNIKGIPARTKTLVNQKENLNNSIYNDFNTAKGQKFAGDLNDAIRNDLAEYGKNNPEWYGYFTKADALHSKKATRKTLEKLLSGKAESYATGELTYNSLSKVLNTPESKDKLKHLVKPEIFERLEKLGTVSQAMARKNKGTINPSGTAVAQTTINWISGLVGLGGYKAGAFDFQTAALLTIGSTGVAHLLTDKKSLDLAIKFAENSNPANAVKFSQRMKAITGYTPVTLLREAQKLEQENQEENGNDLGQRFNRHIEENKAKPKAPAFNKTIEDMYNNKYIKNFIGAD